MREMHLGDLLELVIDHRGKTPKKLGGEFTESGIPVVSAIHIKNGVIQWSERERFVSREIYERWMPVRLRKGDVLLTSEAPLGETALVSSDDDLVLSQRLFALRGKKGVLDSQYLRYFLASQVGQDRLSERATGTTVAGIRQAELMKVLIPVPPIDEQRRIAGVLGALDDLIEVNRRLVRDLEALATARFIQVIDALGVDAETCSLASTVEILSGGTPKTSESTFWNGDIPWFSVADVPSESQTWVLSTEKSITEQGLSGSAAKLVPIGSTILTARGTVGKTALAGAPMTINQSCYALVCRAGGKGYFNLYRIRAAVGNLQRMSHGSVFSTITRDTLHSVQVPSVSAEVIRVFDAEVDPYFQQMRALIEENTDLGLARDELLPLLMSGHVRVSHAVAA